jgi:two-component system LytT family response regulator
MKAVNRIIEINQQAKLMLSTANSFRIVELDQISYLKGWGCCTEIYLTNNKKIVSTSRVVVYEELLLAYPFFKINKATFVNLNQVESYNYKKKTIQLKNNQEVEVSRRKQKDFVNAIYELTIRVVEIKQNKRVEKALNL